MLLLACCRRWIPWCFGRAKVLSLTACLGISGAVLAIAPPPVAAADLAKGKRLARQCTVCHGRNGIARDPEVPHIAGQSEIWLEKSLKAYRSGERKDHRMVLTVKGLSDEDIRDLAAWFAAFTIEVTPPDG